MWFKDLIDFETHTCLSSIFFPLHVKLFSACWILLFFQSNQSTRSWSSTCFIFFFFFFLRAIILTWRMQTRLTEASEFQTPTREDQSWPALRMCLPVHAPSSEWKTQNFSLCTFIAVQRGNKIHRKYCCSFNSMFQKVRHNRINNKFLTAYHQFW